MKLPFEAKGATILVGSGTDIICIDLDGPTAFPAMKYDLSAKIEAQTGCGEQWVKENLPGVPYRLIRINGAPSKHS